MSNMADTEGQGGPAHLTGTSTTEKPQASRRKSRFVRIAAIVSALCLAIYAAGFAIFLSEVSAYRTDAPVRRADGIVVLTGGVARIDEAVKLLNAEKGDRLLISGVHPSASRSVLAKTFAVDKDRFACCVDIDHKALDTVGNANETADWAAAHDYRSLLVVTNDYHMPRSLVELHSAMKDVELIPHAVVANQHQDDDADDQASRYRVLLGEYAKYSAARVRTLVAPRLGAGDEVRRAALSASD
jgi:uncharacterized SAM-binding protein YcdF (DUF218 family)